MTFADGALWWLVLGALAGWLAAWGIGRGTQRLLSEPVVQIMDRVVDNPRHIARIASLEAETVRLRDLEAQVAVVSSMQARIDELLATPPRVVEKVVTRTVDRVVEKPVERIVEKVVERPVPDAAAIGALEAALDRRSRRLEHLEALAAVQAERLAAAPASAADAGATA
jgi:hypothetical protein